MLILKRILASLSLIALTSISVLTQIPGPDASIGIDENLGAFIPLDQHLVLPAPENISLLGLLRVLSLFVHLPFMGIVFGCAICSVIFILMGREEKEGSYFLAASRLSGVAAYRKSASFFLGVLPMITVMLIDIQLLYNPGWTVLRYQPVSLLVVIIGFIFLYRYKNGFVSERSGSIWHVLSGLLGMLLLLWGYALFLAVQARLGDPEKWPFIEDSFELLWSWSVLIKFKMFLAVSFSLTGTGIIFFLFRWQKREISSEKAHDRFLAYFGAGLALFFILVVPILWILDILTSPETFLSKKVFFVTGVAFLLLLIASLFVYRILREAKTSLSIPAFFSIVLVFLFEVLFNQFSITNANLELLTRLKTAAEEKIAEVPSVQKEEGAEGARLAKGEEVFNDICTLCHEFTEELVGPSFLDVIPKYFGAVEELKDYIRKPVKKDPDYPEMPEPGLEEEELDAVAEYILQEVQKMKSKEKQ